MATENKKMKDPAEAALSAIEQALNLDDSDPGGRPDATAPGLPRRASCPTSRTTISPEAPSGPPDRDRPVRAAVDLDEGRRAARPSWRPTGPPSPTTTARASA
jgi:hypothetical protein